MTNSTKAVETKNVRKKDFGSVKTEIKTDTIKTEFKFTMKGVKISDGKKSLEIEEITCDSTHDISNLVLQLGFLINQ